MLPCLSADNGGLLVRKSAWSYRVVNTLLQLRCKQHTLVSEVLRFIEFSILLSPLTVLTTCVLSKNGTGELVIDMRWHGDVYLHGLLCAANLGMFCCCIFTVMHSLLCKAAVPWP